MVRLICHWQFVVRANDTDSGAKPLHLAEQRNAYLGGEKIVGKFAQPRHKPNSSGDIMRRIVGVAILCLLLSVLCCRGGVAINMPFSEPLVIPAPVSIQKERGSFELNAATSIVCTDASTRQIGEDWPCSCAHLRACHWSDDCACGTASSCSQT